MHSDKASIGVQYRYQSQSQLRHQVQSLANGPRDPALPRIGAIVAQPPKGFLTVPVAQLDRELDEMQHVRLVTGVRPSFGGAGSVSIVTESLDELGRRDLVVDLNMALDVALATARRSAHTRFVIEHFGGANLYVVAFFRSLLIRSSLCRRAVVGLSAMCLQSMTVTEIYN